MNNFKEKIYRLKLKHIRDIIELQSCHLAELRFGKKPYPIEHIEKAEMQLLKYEYIKQKIIEEHTECTDLLGDRLNDQIT
tara:strand:+ start:48 stop:287 length:240 start_codon:yes stop_codon:yes gene_type:complete